MTGAGGLIEVGGDQVPLLRGPALEAAVWRGCASDTTDVYLARSGQQVTLSAPAFHCEANFSGNIDTTDPEEFTVAMSNGCTECDYSVAGTAAEDWLTAEYVIGDGTCRYVVHFEGTRSPF